MLTGILISELSSVATTARLERYMGQRACRLSGHVILGGLGAVGYRVAHLLSDIGVPTVVVDLSPNARFVKTVRWKMPVLTGDIRLAEDLRRAGIERASCLIAVTTDDLANLEACLHVKRLNRESEQRIRAIARVFNPTFDQRFRRAFEFDKDIRLLAAARAAAPAFAEAARDESALRAFDLGGKGFLGYRYEVTGGIDMDQIRQWSLQGVRLVAFRRNPDGHVQSPSKLSQPLHEGDSFILVGPEDRIRPLAGAT